MFLNVGQQITPLATVFTEIFITQGQTLHFSSLCQEQAYQNLKVQKCILESQLAEATLKYFYFKSHLQKDAGECVNVETCLKES